MVKLAVENQLKPKGLLNNVNTCFFNSSMQCLLSIDDFTRFVMKTKFDRNSQPISYLLQEFVGDYKASSHSYNPSKFIQQIKTYIPLFRGRQEDAHEFFNVLLDKFIEENKDSPIEKLFAIETEDTIICLECNYTSPRKFHSNIHHLLIKKNVHTSLKYYVEHIDDIDDDSPYTCDKCMKRVSAQIQHDILDTSSYIIIYLNRFNNINNSFQKNTTPIEVEKELTVNDKSYILIGVVCHMGSLSSGHYLAFCKRNERYYVFNDNFYEKTTKMKFKSDTPYFLFYKNKDLE
ncbi:UBP2 [Hepatospora eriocheir]|uniref:UBP2 n=1 Tax=Hepatospora eriocheir TaxID=1081669 RepID=A0A1X0QL38_9MICR|nr:UBP2 [Hepatospora eriocheir]